ncbi:hypothetical protein Salat_0150200 [Sesamum alatum]|uniref:RNase H type-1 domain-containing protein n=1 Tax=Sesamum alatum TaxID=300844 RepID=A0AAE1YX00_9LAMI|nr:hypothetical protein Salat_0150200 [Sesamum alatum]
MGTPGRRGLVRDVFLEEIAQLILSIPLGRTCQDLRIWHFAKNGLFSVRSSYNLARELEEQDRDTCSFAQPARSWDFIWNSRAPHRAISGLPWQCMSVFEESSKEWMRTVHVKTRHMLMQKPGNIFHVFSSAHMEDKGVGGRREPDRWERPPQGWIKVNFDAVVHQHLNGVGVGAISRDWEECCVCWNAVFFLDVKSATQAEALAARVAAELTNTLGSTDLILEGDCLEVINQLRKGNPEPTLIKPIVQDKLATLQGANKILFAHVK